MKHHLTLYTKCPDAVERDVKNKHHHHHHHHHHVIIILETGSGSMPSAEIYSWIQKRWIFRQKETSDFFLILYENVDCVYSLEWPMEK